MINMVLPPRQELDKAPGYLLYHMFVGVPSQDLDLQCHMFCPPFFVFSE